MAQGITTYNYGILRPSGDIMFGPWAAYFPLHLWQGCEIVPMFVFSGVLISDMRCIKSVVFRVTAAGRRLRAQQLQLALAQLLGLLLSGTTDAHRVDFAINLG